MLLLIAFAVIAYLLGSLSSAIIVCKLMGLPDPRTGGSGNPGTTNVLRLGGRGAAAIVLLGDLLKGFIPVFVAKLLIMNLLYLGLIALAAVLGHLFPIFFKFKGGKGVATAFGAILALSFPLGLMTGGIWLLTIAIFHYSSLAAITATIGAPVISLWIAPYYFLPISLISALVIWRHYDNIGRLLKGEESKIKLGKTTE